MANGLKIVVDANVSTTCLATALTGGTQDQMYVVASDECHLWEDPNAPLLIRAEQPAAASLGVLLVVYGYFGFTQARYSGGSVVINGRRVGHAVLRLIHVFAGRTAASLRVFAVLGVAGEPARLAN